MKLPVAIERRNKLLLILVFLTGCFFVVATMAIDTNTNTSLVVVDTVIVSVMVITILWCYDSSS